jgi:hypothetical protein
VGSRDVTEIGPQRLERVPPAVDFAGRAEPAAPEKRSWRTPALDGVLEQEAGYHGWPEEAVLSETVLAHGQLFSGKTVDKRSVGRIIRQ